MQIIFFVALSKFRMNFRNPFFNFLSLKIKFIYSQKDTKFCEISTNYLTGSSLDK